MQLLVTGEERSHALDSEKYPSPRARREIVSHSDRHFAKDLSGDALQRERAERLG